MAARFRAPLALLVLLVVALRALRRKGRLRRLLVGRPAPSYEKPGSLRYRVPVGQDPAAVVTTLRQAGYEVIRDEAPTHIQELVIQCPAGPEHERARVRSVIAQAPVDLGGSPAPEHLVRFADEPGTVQPIE
jgi:hypothetical protein